jgi:hypothetical protein
MKQSYVTVNMSLMKTTVAVGDNSNSSQVQNTLGILVVPILSVRSHWIEDRVALCQETFCIKSCLYTFLH